jgi:hypothetical protein
MKRFQFGLRLFLLIITLLATCFAWRGAVRLKERTEREIVRTRYKAMMAAEERWRATVIEDMKRAPNDPQAMPRSSGLAHLKYVDAKIVTLREQLDSTSNPATQP